MCPFRNDSESFTKQHTKEKMNTKKNGPTQSIYTICKQAQNTRNTHKKKTRSKLVQPHGNINTSYLHFFQPDVLAHTQNRRSKDQMKKNNTTYKI